MVRFAYRFWTTGLTVACALVVLSACNRAEDRGPLCPAGAIVNGLDAIEGFAPGARSIDNLRYSVSLTDIVGRCTYRNNTLTLSYSVDLAAQRGPALQSPEVAVPYFVAVVDDTGQVISKDLFTSSFTLTLDQPTMRKRDSFEQTIDGVDPNSVSFYSVLFGFQSDPEDALRRRSRNL